MSDIKARSSLENLNYSPDQKYVTGTNKNGKFLLDVSADGSFVITDTDGNVVSLQDVAGIFSVPVKVTDITLSNQDDSISTFDLYQLQDLDESDPTYLFVGLTKTDGTWLIKRLKTSAGEMRYGNPSNNTGVSYTDAWTNRLMTTNYDYIFNITGV